MSIFAKSVSSIDFTDLNDLVATDAVENIRLEFKREVPLKDETLKKLSSFANTFGGHLIVGAEASSADGRIVGLPGVEPQPGYKQKVVQWSISSGSGKVCYVLYAPESDPRDDTARSTSVTQDAAARVTGHRSCPPHATPSRRQTQ